MVYLVVFLSCYKVILPPYTSIVSQNLKKVKAFMLILAFLASILASCKVYAFRVARWRKILISVAAAAPSPEAVTT